MDTWTSKLEYCQNKVGEWLLTGIRDQIGLKLAKIHVKSSVKPQGGSNGRYHLRNQAIEMLVVRARDVKIPSTDIIDSLIVNQERTVRIFDGAVGRQDRIVRLDDRSAYLRSRVHGELEF